MRNALIAIAAAVTLVSQVSGQVPAPAPTKIDITFEGNGVVSLSATNASVRDILNEWRRKGGTQFDGVDRLMGPAVTLQFDHRSETEVMTSLLRNASGFVIGPRSGQSTGPSSFEVVYVLASSTATSSGFSPAPSYVPPPQPTTQGSPDTEIPPVGPGRAGSAPPAQTDAPPPSPRPAGVGGVAVPVVTVPVSSSTPPPAGTTGTGPGRGGGGGR